MIYDKYKFNNEFFIQISKDKFYIHNGDDEYYDISLPNSDIFDLDMHYNDIIMHIYNIQELSFYNCSNTIAIYGKPPDIESNKYNDWEPLMSLYVSKLQYDIILDVTDNSDKCLVTLDIKEKR